MDDNKSPQDILDEIMNRPRDPSPLSYASPAFEPTSLDDIPPPAPETREKAGSPKRSAQLFPWLCVALGVALLALGVCVFRLVVVNARLGELRQAEADAQSADSLREENDQLRQELSELQVKFDDLQQELKDTWDETYEEGQRSYVQRTELEIRMRRSEYLSFIQQFIDHGDLPMAAIVMVLEDEYLCGTPPEWFVPDYSNGELPHLNSIQQERYLNYQDILVKAGLLEERINIALAYLSSIQAPTILDFAEQQDPSTNPNMAALGILWCALKGYYIEGDLYKAAQFLTMYQYNPLAGIAQDQEVLPFPQRLQNTAGEETLRLYHQLIRDLVDDGILVEDAVGLAYAPGIFLPDILYPLPFNLPYLEGIPE